MSGYSSHKVLNVLLIVLLLGALAVCALRFFNFEKEGNIPTSTATQVNNRYEKNGRIKANKRLHVKDDTSHDTVPEEELTSPETEELLEMFYQESIEDQMEIIARQESPLSKMTVNVTDMKSLGKQLGELHKVIKNFSAEDQKLIGNASLWLLVDAAMASEDPSGFGIRPGMTEQERAEAGKRTQQLIIGVFKEFNGSTYYDMIGTIIDRADGRPPAEDRWKAIMRGEPDM